MTEENYLKYLQAYRLAVDYVIDEDAYMICPPPEFRPTDCATEKCGSCIRAAINKKCKQLFKGSHKEQADE